MPNDSDVLSVQKTSHLVCMCHHHRYKPDIVIEYATLQPHYQHVTNVNNEARGSYFNALLHLTNNYNIMTDIV